MFPEFFSSDWCGFGEPPFFHEFPGLTLLATDVSVHVGLEVASWRSTSQGLGHQSGLVRTVSATQSDQLHIGFLGLLGELNDLILSAKPLVEIIWETSFTYDCISA